MSQWTSHYHVLQSKLKELEVSSGNREEIQVERLPDDLDNALALSNLEVAVSRMNRSQDLLRQVRTALKRFETGEYGKCLDCEEEISEKRLLILPWAERCISCQESKED